MNSYKYYQNKDCEYFPCHKIANDGFFNCMFCFCPLYALGEKCGGDFSYTADGIKDCSVCTLVHGKGGYEHVIDKLSKQK